MKLAIGYDHAGYEMQEELNAFLQGHCECDIVVKEGPGLRKQDQEDRGITLQTRYPERYDYPKAAHAVAQAIVERRADAGLLICGSGIGMAMAANKHSGIRAAVCSTILEAELARNHNDANVLCLGARFLANELAMIIIKKFLSERFDGGRHANRVGMIDL